MTKINSSILILSTLLLSSCGNIAKYTEAEFGSHKGYKKMITEVIIKTAKNPDAIRIRNMSKPKKTLIQNTGLNALWKPYFPAYGICAEYGGTNSYGGFIVSSENFYLRNGQLVYSYIAEVNGKNGYTDVPALDRYKPCLNK